MKKKDERSSHPEVGKKGTRLLKTVLDHGMIYSYRRR
jgi:hypothetical protein